MVCFSTRRLPWRNNLATFRYCVSSRRVEESPRHAPAPLPGRGTAPTRPQQKLPSATRHAVPGLGHLTYLSRFRRQPRICPSCWQDTEQRRGGLQQGFCLTLGACSHCRDTLLFQRQFCKARARAAKRLLFLEVKNSSSKTHPKPSSASLFRPLMPCPQASAHLCKEQTGRAPRGGGQREATAQAGLRGQRSMPSPARNDAEKHAVPSPRP